MYWDYLDPCIFVHLAKKEGSKKIQYMFKLFLITISVSKFKFYAGMIPVRVEQVETKNIQ